MRISDLISMTVKNLLRRKTRTLLTVAGVIVGTCSIVLMVSLGIGQTEALEQSISQMGDLTMIQVYSYGGENAQTVLNDETMQKILAMDGVQAGTPYYNAPNMNLKLFSGKKDRYQMQLWSVRGVYADQLEDMGFNLAEGELLPVGGPVQTGKNKTYKMLMGKSMVYEFTDSKAKGQAAYRWEGMLDANGNQLPPFVDPMEDELTLVMEHITYNEDGTQKVDEARYEVEISGVLGSKDPNTYDENSYSLYMDINDLKGLYEEYKETFDIEEDKKQTAITYNQAKVKVSDIDMVESVDKAIKDMGFETYSLNSVREPMMEQMQQQQLFLGGIGGISLLVAAIGISNTMVMSIYERTREIGIMKVLGCRLGNIRSVFLMEAGLIGFFGGVAGVGISYGISYGLNHLTMIDGVLSGIVGSMLGGMGGGGNLSVIPLWLAGAAVVFATIIGLLSGFSPANRAVKISALEAIKHE